MKIRVAKKPADSYQHGDLRAALVEAGIKLLTEGGIERLSLRAAAQLAGVSHAAPYRHYRDKDALLAAIAERGFRLLTASMRRELSDSPARNASERLQALGVGYIAFAVEQPAYLQLISSDLLCKPDVPADLVAAASEAFVTLRDTVAQGIASGELRFADVDDTTLACWSMVHGFSSLIVNRALPGAASAQPARDLGKKILDVLGAGTDPLSPTR